MGVGLKRMGGRPTEKLDNKELRDAGPSPPPHPQNNSCDNVYVIGGGGGGGAQCANI